ncbi:hypothetical protein ACQP1W_43445 [Spirillospora sp. CA-255316]
MNELRPRATAYTGGWPDCFVAVALCQVGRSVLDAGVPVDGNAETHPLHVHHRDGGWQSYLLGAYFEERRGLDHVLNRVREKQRARS